MVNLDFGSLRSTRRTFWGIGLLDWTLLSGGRTLLPFQYERMLGLADIRFCLLVRDIH
jgi:hypothetical protein